MKKWIWSLCFIFWFVGFKTTVKAQDVYIDIPQNYIFDRMELSTVKNILNTGSHNSWRNIIGIPINPTIRSTSGNFFKHTILEAILPTSVLPWRLHSIGGEIPPFGRGDSWPSFKWFTSSDQTWYQPNRAAGSSKYTPGPIAFSFKIPPDSYSNNAFYAGNYSLEVTQNYSGGLYAVDFTPSNLKIFLTVPSALIWLSPPSEQYKEISSLNTYRSNGDQSITSFGVLQLGNTVDFNLWAKTTATSIFFTSSKGVEGNRPLTTVTLQSANPKINALPLSNQWRNYSSNGSFNVNVGNRQDFVLELAITAADFKNYFFEAGSYTFQLNLEARSTDNAVSSPQNINVTLKVPSLSEITIPNSGHTVNFQFNTATQYQNGQTKIAPDQIKISNNETFELYVKSETPYFKRSGTQSDVPSNILEIGLEGGSSISLAPTSQKIITHGNPVLDKNLNIKYTIPPNAAQTLVSKEKSIYSINVIYSFTAL